MPGLLVNVEQIKASATTLLAGEYPDLPGETVSEVVTECVDAAPPERDRAVAACRVLSLARARLDARRVTGPVIDLTDR